VLAVVAVTAVLAAVAVLVSWVWVSRTGLDAKDRAAAQLDVLKTGLSIGLGGGGIFALYLWWRRQRSTEEDLDQRERALELQHQVAATTEDEARERRITELYTKAAEQLGSDKAPVRLAGLYALERLAQGTPDQRQTSSTCCAPTFECLTSRLVTRRPRTPTSRPSLGTGNGSRNAKSGSPPNASSPTICTSTRTPSIEWTPSGRTSTSTSPAPP
jgi:hypothetical protein